MVRILSCHHFRGQRIGRCEEAVAVAVAGENVVVALEHQVNIYGKNINFPNSPQSPSPPTSSTDKPTREIISPTTHDNHDIGATFVFQKGGSSTQMKGPPTTATSSVTSSVESIESDADLRLLHNFSTIDSIESMTYNEKGKYLLGLEKRSTSATTISTCVRAYFHWQINHGQKPMRARIAGLVSPTGAEPEDDSLMMVEIPLTSPATAIASCNLTGHIACLSAESIINLFVFRSKEVTGRIKVHYYDFDRMYAVEMPGFIPEQICFLSNYIVCMNTQKTHVFRMKKCDAFNSPDTSTSSLGVGEQSNGSKALPSGVINSFQKLYHRPQTPSTIPTSDKVVFDPKNETCKVHLNSIVRANRKRHSPSGLLNEEFGDEIISNRSKLVFSASNPSILIEDALRVSVAANAGTRLMKVGMYPVRIKDHLGGIALMISTQKEGFLYHLPSKRGCQVARVVTYPFTAPLITFTFDSLFFHALTETGLESYTTRTLFYAIKDVEGLTEFENDCPFQDEAPSLVGIRPFLNVRKMSCNSHSLCLLASAANSQVKNSTVQTEESSWTIYSLDQPDIDMVYEDVMRTAQLQVETNPASYFVLLCEAHILLRTYMNAHLDANAILLQRYREICKLIGLAYLKSSWLSSQSPENASSSSVVAQILSPSSPSQPSLTTTTNITASVPYLSNVSDDMVDKGVTYMLMCHCGVQEIFSPENWALIREPCYIPGFVRLIEVVFLKSGTRFTEHQRLSPTLAPVLVEFLANNGPKILTELVIQQPFIRDCNSKRLLNILQNLAESCAYAGKETLAFLLTLVTVNAVDSATRTQFKTMLQNAKLKDLSDNVSKEIIFETRNQQTFLTEFAVCLASSENQSIFTQKISQFLRSDSISISLVMFAFTQAINVNSDSELQHSITKCLIEILEIYFSEKLNSTKSSTINSVDTSDEEKRAIQLLVRTYLSNINSSAHSNKPIEQSLSINSVEINDEKVPIQDLTSVDILQKNQIFGNFFSCVNYLLSINSAGGTLTPQNQNIVTSNLFNNEDSRENYIKLLSLLANPSYGNLEGVKEIIVSYLAKNTSQAKPPLNITLILVLQILSETPEKAINLLIVKQPTTLMLFAKETFGKNPLKWKILVGQLKKNIQGNCNTLEADVYSTILESVYLHLANSLSPLELEQVLDKETEESNKFHGICKRVELANTYANMVITVSSEYLSHK